MLNFSPNSAWKFGINKWIYSSGQRNELPVLFKTLQVCKCWADHPELQKGKYVATRKHTWGFLKFVMSLFAAWFTIKCMLKRGIFINNIPMNQHRCKSDGDKLFSGPKRGTKLYSKRIKGMRTGGWPGRDRVTFSWLFWDTISELRENMTCRAFIMRKLLDFCFWCYSEAVLVCKY